MALLLGGKVTETGQGQGVIAGGGAAVDITGAVEYPAPGLNAIGGTGTTVDIGDTFLKITLAGNEGFLYPAGTQTATFTFQLPGGSPGIGGITLTPVALGGDYAASDVTFTNNSVTLDIHSWQWTNFPASLAINFTPAAAVAVAPDAGTPPPPKPPNYYPTLNADFGYILRYYTFGSNPPLPDTVTTPTGQVLPNPLIENQKQVQLLANLVNSGAMSLQTALDKLVDLADGTTSVATLSYQFFTGHIPTKEGLDYLVSSPLNPTDLNDGFYAGMSLENRYINFAVNLGKPGGEGAAFFAANYGALNLSDATAKAYAEIFGVTPTAAKLAAILTPDRIAYLTSMGGNDIGTKAAMVGFLLGEAAKSDAGPYAVMNENFLYDLADGVAGYGVDLHDYLNAGPTKVGVIPVV